jgi:hypothetical protein
MKNFQLSVVYDSGAIPLCFASGRDAVQWLGGYSDEETIRRVHITAITDDGRRVSISISNDSDTRASIRIEEAQLVNE